MFTFRIFFMLFCLLLLQSCQRVQNAAYNMMEAPYAKRRVAALLEKDKIPFENLHCEMMNTTRNFACTFTVTDERFETHWVKQLTLEQGTPESTRQRYLHTRYPQNCEKKPPFDQDLNASRFALFENKVAQFPAVQGLEYMVVYLDQTTRQACVQASHSLG